MNFLKSLWSFLKGIGAILLFLSMVAGVQLLISLSAYVYFYFLMPILPNWVHMILVVLFLIFAGTWILHELFGGSSDVHIGKKQDSSASDFLMLFYILRMFDDD